MYQDVLYVHVRSSGNPPAGTKLNGAPVTSGFVAMTSPSPIFIFKVACAFWGLLSVTKEEKNADWSILDPRIFIDLLIPAEIPLSQELQ